MTMLTIAAPCSRCMQPKSIHHVVYGEPPINQGGTTTREVAIQCTHCHKHSIAILDAIAHVPLGPNDSPLRGDIEKLDNYMTLLAIIPDMPVNAAPAHVPAPVANAFVDGLDVLALKKWTPAAASFRMALDRASQVLWGTSKEDMPFKLDKRLKALQGRIGLPASMLDWAENIRVVGNEIHELDDVSAKDAVEVAHFTEMFLTYSFTLPRQVEEFRKRRAG